MYTDENEPTLQLEISHYRRALQRPAESWYDIDLHINSELFRLVHKGLRSSLSVTNTSPRFDTDTIDVNQKILQV